MSQIITPSKINGFYDGPPIEEGVDAVISHFKGIPIRLLEQSTNGSVKIAIDFHTDPQDSRKNLSTEIAFVSQPGDWSGFTHHIIASTQFGCNHGCRMCVDGLPASWKAHLSAEQMVYAAAHVLEIANRFRSISSGATIKLLQVGSGDPFANADHVARFIPAVRQIDDRIKYVYTSTAGALTKRLPTIITATKASNKNGIAVGSQFSTHTFVPENRQDLVLNPRTTALELAAAAKTFLEETAHQNDAFINYMVVPGWNNTATDARLVAVNVPERAILKLVALNSVRDLNNVTDDKGNMYVLNFHPEYIGQRDQWGNAINQIIVPPYLQVECARENVLSFGDEVRHEMQRIGRNFQIITPEDQAAVIGAACGSVGGTIVSRHTHPLVTKIQAATLGN